MHLDRYRNGRFDRGAPRVVEIFWIIIGGILIDSWLPGSGWRKMLLRLFGAQVAHGVVVKPRLRVKFPWRLELGEHCWVGEGVWIDNLAQVKLGSHSCVSQGTYLCTGSHDWSLESFDLIVAPIEIGSHAWIGARCNVAPGTKVGEGAVVALGSTIKGTTEPWSQYSGQFAARRGRRSQRYHSG